MYSNTRVSFRLSFVRPFACGKYVHGWRAVRLPTGLGGNNLRRRELAHGSSAAAAAAVCTYAAPSAVAVFYSERFYIVILYYCIAMCVLRRRDAETGARQWLLVRNTSGGRVVFPWSEINYNRYVHV